jgi:hypothetical protein
MKHGLSSGSRAIARANFSAASAAVGTPSAPSGRQRALTLIQPNAYESKLYEGKGRHIRFVIFDSNPPFF